MNRLLTVISVFLILVLVGGVAGGGLNSSDKTKLRRWMTTYLDPRESEEKRQDALADFRQFFQDKRKSKYLGDVSEFIELLGISAKRPRIKRTGIIVQTELALKEFKFKAAISIPKKYSGGDNDKPWPLILCFPDKGETPVEYIDKYWKTAGIRSKYLIVALEYTYEDVEIEKQVQIKDEETNQIRVETVKEKVPFTWESQDAYSGFWISFVTLMLNEFKVDPERVLVDGTGFGASGALATAVGTTWRFSGVVVRGGSYEGPMLENLKHIRVLSLPHEGAGEEAKKTLEELRTLLGEGLEEGSGAEWSAADDESGAKLTKWLAGCVRNRYPLPTKWTFFEKVHQFGYWFYITKRFDSGKPASMELSADQKDAKIEIVCSNVKEFTLFLNDIIVDMNEPFDLFVNGKKIQQFSAERNPGTFLAHALLQHPHGKPPSDPGGVFMNEITGISVEPPEEKPPEDDGDKKPEEGDQKPGDGDGEKKKADPEGGDKKADKPEEGGEKKAEPGGGGEKTDKPEGGGEKKDKPEGGGEKKDKPEGGGEKKDKPEGGDKKTDKPEGG